MQVAREEGANLWTLAPPPEGKSSGTEDAAASSQTESDLTE